MTDGTNKKLGIGTTTPVAPLHVNGGDLLAAGFYQSAVFYKSDLADGEKLDVTVGKSDAMNEAFIFRYHYNPAASSQLAIHHFGDSNSFVIAKGGNVGLGTLSPGTRLDIADGAVTMQEMLAPPAPAGDKCVIYAEDNGSGKTRLMVKFATGAAQQIAIEP